MMPMQAPKQVLLADPGDKSRHLLSSMLRERGFDVIETIDGSRTLAETLLRRPDILLLDLSLPVLGTERLVQILRTNPNTKSIPIFFLSETEKSVAGFRPGTDDFIRRPYNCEELVLRIQRALQRDGGADLFAGDSEISGSLSQVFLPDLWQMLAMNAKSGVIQVEGEGMTGSIYIERGEIVSAVTRNTHGEKALYRLIALKEGKFRFVPGKVDVRTTIHASSQQAILEGLRHFDEIRHLNGDLPVPDDSVVLVKNVREVSGGVGAVREVLLLAEFCNRVEDIVNNCSYPDLVVYETLLELKKRGVLRIGSFEAAPSKSRFLPPDDLARLRTRMEEVGGFSESNVGRIVLFLPDPDLLEGVVLALGRFQEFEMDGTFFSLLRREGAPIGMFGRLKVGEGSSVLLYAFPYVRATSPLWYALAPRPLGIIAFLKDEVSSSLEGLLAVSDYTRGAEARAVLAVMGKTFTNFGLGENIFRLFQKRVETLGCSLKVQEMDRLSPEEIRETLGRVVRQYLDGAQA
jgi:CheY-like chemotaxis protein